MKYDHRLTEEAENHPYPLLFVTVSGAHLYGFPSPDSDWDLRGVHVLPAAEVVGLKPTRDTIEVDYVADDGFEMDLVTHDVKKFMGLMLKRNGYVLEQLLSPLVIDSTPEHAELKALAKDCITRHHAHHYLGFARNQWGMFLKDTRVKPLLYTYRTLLTGIHLMRSGEVQANLIALNEEFKLDYLPELIQRKLEGPEKGVLGDPDIQFHKAEFDRLFEMLETAREASSLPEEATAQEGLHDLLVRVRLQDRS